MLLASAIADDVTEVVFLRLLFRPEDCGGGRRAGIEPEFEGSRLIIGLEV
jgi:hypothetical protein